MALRPPPVFERLGGVRSTVCSGAGGCDWPVHDRWARGTGSRSSCGRLPGRAAHRLHGHAADRFRRLGGPFARRPGGRPARARRLGPCALPAPPRSLGDRAQVPVQGAVRQDPGQHADPAGVLADPVAGPGRRAMRSLFDRCGRSPRVWSGSPAPAVRSPRGSGRTGSGTAPRCAPARRPWRPGRLETFPQIGVMIAPGCTTLTSTPSGRGSRRRTSVSASWRSGPSAEAPRRGWPRCRARMSRSPPGPGCGGAAAAAPAVTASWPTTLVSSWRRSRAGETHSSGAETQMPALFTSPHSPASPTASAISSAAAAIVLSSVTSRRTERAIRPAPTAEARVAPSASCVRRRGARKPDAARRSAQAGRAGGGAGDQNRLPRGASAPRPLIRAVALTRRLPWSGAVRNGGGVKVSESSRVRTEPGTRHEAEIRVPYRSAQALRLLEVADAAREAATRARYRSRRSSSSPAQRARQVLGSARGPGRGRRRPRLPCPSPGRGW